VPHVRVINGGDGQHQHPTQGLLDAFTVRQVLCERHDTTASSPGGDVRRSRILIVGDIRHSRVARSDVAAYATLGAEVRLCVGHLLPEEVATWPSRWCMTSTRRSPWADVVGLLRLQSERGSGAFVASLDEFTFTNGLTVERARLMKPELDHASWSDEPRRGNRFAASSIRAARSSSDRSATAYRSEWRCCT